MLKRRQTRLDLTRPCRWLWAPPHKLREYRKANGRKAGIFFAVILACLSGTAVGQSAHAREDQVKAAYLYNFAKFVEWPSTSFRNANDAIVICSIGDDPIGEALQQAVLGKRANGRRVEARNIGLVRESKFCHILFIGFRDPAHIQTILHGLEDASVLTVCQTDDLAAVGGIINLVRKNESIELEINPEAAQASSLKISSRLMVVSRVVTSHGRGQ